MARLKRAEKLRKMLDGLSVLQAQELGASVGLDEAGIASAQLAAIGGAPVLKIGDGAEWAAGLLAAAGTKAAYKGKAYEALISHLTQPDWPPDLTPVLWKETSGELSPWFQPLGAHDAYMEGGRVTHLGLLWESTVDYNTWEPGIYGWKEI